MSFCLNSSALHGLNLGSSEETASEDPIKVAVVNEDPIQTTESEISEVREIARSIQLDFEKEYQSAYLDVRDYRSVAFYVIPEKMLREPETPVLYRLDAFFSMDTGTVAYKKFGEKEDEALKKGHQEFGSTKVEEEGSVGVSSFAKLSTGRTHSRVLYSPIYGPYVYVVLKSLTPQDGRKFRIIAYLSR